MARSNNWKKTTPFVPRDQILAQLGFSSYYEYLCSDLWKSIREKVFQLKGRRCVCCGRQATQVHHQSYTESSLSGRSVHSLFPSCGPCHRSTHFTKKGVFRKASQSKGIFKQNSKLSRKQKKQNKIRRAMAADREFHARHCDK